MFFGFGCRDCGECFGVCVFEIGCCVDLIGGKFVVCV